MIVFNRILRLLLALPLVFIMITIVTVNVKLNYQPELVIDKSDTIHFEFVKELRGLKKALNNHADIEMQRIYPEGYVFLNAVYALAWSAFLQDEGHHKFLEEGHAEIHNAWIKINSPAGRAYFSEELSLPYGAFYNGWSSYVLASKLRLENVRLRNDQEVQYFKLQCDGIAGSIQRETFPPSYPGGAWPADVMLCVASLSLHDKLFEPRYKGVVDKWLTEVKQRLDAHGMLPHAVHSTNGSAEENARGSSMALMLILLYEIDFPFAQDQFTLFKENFVDVKYGLTGVREYPKGESGTGDIDSGPIILGFGGAATIVGMQTLSIFGERELSLKIRNAVESVAFPIQGENEKEYFFGSMPIADAFIAWSHTNMTGVEPRVLFLRFHLCSILVFALLSTFLWMLIKIKSIATKDRR